MPTEQRNVDRKRFARKVEQYPKKIQVGARGKKIGDDWISIDLYDKSEIIDHNWNLLDLPIENESVDCFVCNAILEHVPRPELAVYEMYRTLRTGGQIWVEVPFLQFYHAHPYDFTRWTISGIEMLMSDFERCASGIAEGAAYEAEKFFRYVNADARLPIDEEHLESVGQYIREREAHWTNPRFYSSVYFWGEKTSRVLAAPKKHYLEHLKLSLRTTPSPEG